MAYVSTPYVWVSNIILGSNGNAVKLGSSTGEIIGTYGAGMHPYGVAVDVDGNVWVADYQANSVTKLSGSTGAVIGTYAVGLSPKRIAIDAGGNVWAANHDSDNVTKLNGSTGAVIDTYAVGRCPGGIAIDTGGNVWVANYDSNNVMKLNASTGVIVGIYNAGNKPIDVAVDTDNNVWVTNRSSSGNTVIKLDGSTGNIIGGCRVGDYPGSVAVDADNNAWVTAQGPDCVVKLNSSGVIVGTYAVDSPVAVAVDVDGNVWVADYQANSVTKLSGSTGAVIGTYSLGAGLSGCGISTGFALQRFTLGYHLPVSGVTISPDSTTIPVNSSKQFESAVLRGDGVSGVAWSAPDGGIVADGLFTPPAAAGTYRVVATSVEDESKSATAAVTVVANHIVKFGNYLFPKTFHVSAAPSETKVPTTEIPRRDGVAVGIPRLKEKNISIKGMLRADTPNELRAAMDNLLAAVNAGRQKLYLWDDRYIRATKTSFTTDYDETSFERYAFVGVDFLCDSPFWEAEEESTDIWESPLGDEIHTLMVGGNAYTMPTFKLTVSGTGALSARIALGTGSGMDFAEVQYFTLEGDVTDGDVIVVDCGTETVTLESDGSDCMSMFDSSFFPLAGGSANTLKFTKVYGEPVISQVATTWRNRWY